MTVPDASEQVGRRIVRWPYKVFGLLYSDKMALVAAAVLVLVLFVAVFGWLIVDEEAVGLDLRARNAEPFTLERGWFYVLGADTLGRSILGRIILAARNALLISGLAVAGAMLVGSTLGLIAGFRSGWLGSLIMRCADILMSFPSLLMAVIILYMLEPSLYNVVLVLAVTRIPIYLRTVRAEVLEARQRIFVTAARVLGASQWRLVTRHLVPVVVPTVLTVGALELSVVMLAEAGLSFLGIGVQPPQITWGLMVAEGRPYLATAWWLSFWPGVAIILTTLALNILANWLRVVLDPQQRWRLEIGGRDQKRTVRR